MLKDYHRNGKYYLDKEKLAQAKAQLGVECQDIVDTF
jgi:hypothetical protein